MKCVATATDTPGDDPRFGPWGKQKCEDTGPLTRKRMTVLKENLKQHPGDSATVLALISFSRDAGDFRTALDYAERLARLMPDDSNLRTLIETLRARAKTSDGQ